jgi:hypothetical protein
MKATFQFRIRGRSDSDYKKDTQTWQNVTGLVVYLEDALVMHCSTTQKTAALSLCGAKLNAALLCAQDMLYVQNLFKSIGLKVELTMVLEIAAKVLITCSLVTS